MDERQLLAAIGQLMDEKINALREETRGIVREETRGIVREETRGIVREETRGIVREETRGIVREEISAQTQRIDERMTRLEISYENQTQKILNLLREDYGRVATAAAKVGDYDEVKSKVNDHDQALQNHNGRITELEKRAI